MLFLPQRPYLPLGTLHRAVCYPRDITDFTAAEVRAALTDAGLGHLAARLEEEDAWDRRLSGGEQQRVALARALLLSPTGCSSTRRRPASTRRPRRGSMRC